MPEVRVEVKVGAGVVVSFIMSAPARMKTDCLKVAGGKTFCDKASLTYLSPC